MKKSLVVSRKWLVVIAVCLTAGVVVAALRLSRRVPMRVLQASTNCEVICGVKMPPMYTQSLWERRQEILDRRRKALEAFQKEFEDLHAVAQTTYYESLNEEQRKAMAELSRLQEQAFGEARAKAHRRHEELVAITNRANYIKREWHEKRRSEYEFHEGLFWLDEPVFKETVSRAEKGKQVVHILYTRGKNGKERRHRYEPDAIRRELENAAKKNKGE